MPFRAVRWLLVATLTSLAVASCGGDGSSATPTPAGRASPADVQLTDADNGRSVEIAQGGTIIVALSSNATTGYSWAVDPSPAPQLTQLGDASYILDAAPPGSSAPAARRSSPSAPFPREPRRCTSSTGEALSRAWHQYGPSQYQ